jgi:hypothetical protein
MPSMLAAYHKHDTLIDIRVESITWNLARIGYFYGRLINAMHGFSLPAYARIPAGHGFMRRFFPVWY